MYSLLLAACRYDVDAARGDGSACAASTDTCLAISHVSDIPLRIQTTINAAPRCCCPSSSPSGAGRTGSASSARCIYVGCVESKRKWEWKCGAG